MVQTTFEIAQDPRGIANRCRSETRLVELTLVSLLLVFSCTACFGVTLGGVRGWQQALFTGVKLPLVWLGSLVFCLPGFYVMSALFGQSLRLRALVALLLAAMARAALVLFACLPVLWLVSDILSGELAYHQVTVLSSAIYGLAALAAAGTFVRAYRFTPQMVPLFGSLCLLFVIVSGQCAWSLRPFIGRPSQKNVPFLRAPEGTFLGAVATSLDSARGHYAVDSNYADSAP